MRPLITCLWFNGQAEAAADFYVDLFPDARIVGVTPYPEGAPRAGGSVMTVEWEIAGQRFLGLNGGPHFTFNEAVSFQILCDTQAEIDRYWAALTADGGEPSPCGWCKDRFGVSWQVIPSVMPDLMRGDPARAARVAAAFMPMMKLEIAVLLAAADG